MSTFLDTDFIIQFDKVTIILSPPTMQFTVFKLFVNNYGKLCGLLG